GPCRRTWCSFWDPTECSASPEVRPRPEAGGQPAQWHTRLSARVPLSFSPSLPRCSEILSEDICWRCAVHWSSVCAKIVQLLGQNEVDHHHKQVVILSQDSFYRVLTTEQKAKALKGQFNFDHPDAFDNELIVKTLKEIMEGKTVQIPVYDFVSHSR
uniref:Phosphoribulokinase/uridine kinase domain-containing protein n=1 Tax=Anolis carolinensis TaxID=28377 RepID=A0A803TKU9_ANOCA